MKPFQLVMVLFGLLLVGGSVFGWVSYTRFLALEKAMKEQASSTQAAIVDLNEKITAVNDSLDEQVNAVAQALSLAQAENADLADKLSSAQRKVERALEDVEDNVGDLEKLANTDPELLQKYSKVFFLNEHYAPPRLTEIPREFTYSETETETIDSRVWPHLEDLLEDAKDDDIELFIKSGFRSFEEQRNTKAGYTITYGAGTANTFSADQGYSEHQLGTTIDFITKGIGGTLDGFQNTDAYQWLVDNAWKYGFVMSYPPGNQYYIFEPWHWRFVGEDLARDLRNDKDFFYDLDQREIDGYLVEIFD